MTLKNPRCKCGKFYGEVYLKMGKKCRRCRTLVKYRDFKK